MEKFIIRQANQNDFFKIFSLYKKVATKTIGIARSSEEITEKYIDSFMTNAHNDGIELVIENLENKNHLIAEIHCLRLTPKIFNHILGNLTIVVDPDFHGKGIGKLIFNKLLELISERKDILRVELVCRETNIKGIELYKKLGFEIEGVMKNRTLTANNIESDYIMAWFNPNFKNSE